MDTGKIKAGACFSLMGPPGTHKLALGMNLATGYISGKDPRRKLLIVSFGGRSPMDLHGVAWFDFRFKWAAWNRPKVEFYRKCWSAEFAYNAKFYNKFGQAQSQSSVGAASKDSGRAPRATQLVFNLGHLTPEECLDAIDKMTATDKYSGVLLSDTASICTGFPLLRKSPLFLPALIDLFRKRDLVSVCLGVQEPRSPEQEMDFALESCADYRIRHSHYPDYNELAKAIVKHAMGAKDETLGLRSEQLVSVVLDNVTGKHYGRDPKWLWVKPGRNSPSPASPPKELCCGPVDEWIEVNKKNKAKSRPK
jgi:hypothetical protein